MKQRTSALPFLIAELTIFSWETLAHRTSMMMQGACTWLNISAWSSRRCAPRSFPEPQFYLAGEVERRWHHGIALPGPMPAGSDGSRTGQHVAVPRETTRLQLSRFTFRDVGGTR
jgi:hypothetical protein